jgi:hypothetical protein
MQILRICAIAVATGCITAHTCTKYTEQEKPHNRQERTIRSLTLEWMSVTHRRISLEFIQEVNLRRLSISKQLGVELPLLNPEVSAAKPVELISYYTLRNTPRASEFVCTFQRLSVVGTEPTPGLTNYERVFVFRQTSGTTILIRLCYNSEGQIVRGDFTELPREKGYTTPSLGLLVPISSTAFVFLNGVSPFRLFDTTPEEWRLKSVSEDEWVFELQQTNRRLQVRVCLSRHHHDAPSRLEIEHPDGHVERWRTLKFQNIEGTWFPSEVEFEVTDSMGHIKSIYTLLGAKRTMEAIQPILDDEFLLNRWYLSNLNANEEITANKFATRSFVRWSELSANIGK